MLLKQNTEMITMTWKDMAARFLPDGSLYELMGGAVQINGFRGNPVDGSANGIYLRIYEGERIARVIPVIGHRAEGTITAGREGFCQAGETNGIRHQVTFLCGEGNCWFFEVALEGGGESADVIYCQDLGMGDQGSVLSNELYINQYLDHTVFEGPAGYAVCSRQNMPQGGKRPYLQQGARGIKAAAYLTDGIQFFGTGFKDSREPEALWKAFPSEKLQQEFAYTGLQTERMVLEGRKVLGFYGFFQADYDRAVTGLEFQSEIDREWERIKSRGGEARDWQEIGRPQVRRIFRGAFNSPNMDLQSVEQFFPERELEEVEQGSLYSFFTRDHSHVVLKEKEVLTERPHGNIITTLVDDREMKEELLTSTNYMYGMFHGQVCVGNTNMNKLLSAARGLLDVLPGSGQRLYVEREDGFYRLGLPSAYEMGMNYSRWYYRIGDDWLLITAYAQADESRSFLEGTSLSGRSYHFLLTNQIVMGEHEFGSQAVMESREDGIWLSPAEGSLQKERCPKLCYRLKLDVPCSVSDDGIFYEDGKSRNGTLLTMAFTAEHFCLAMDGMLYGEPCGAGKTSFEQEKSKYLAFYERFLGSFELSLPGGTDETERKLQKINHISRWYLHNALVHYAVPHGLEQSGGAAWGTRDVCQGPFELFMATGHFELAGNVLLRVISYQRRDTGEWPQWFMSDSYGFCADDCHGDIVFWPLKCMGDYLAVTQDGSILDKRCPYVGAEEEAETVGEHIRRAVEAVSKRFVDDTMLISYAGGDWDDTLQPANKEMKERLVSTWTEALACQTFRRLAEGLRAVDEVLNAPRSAAESMADWLSKTADRIAETFNEVLVPDGITAGFAYVNEDGTIRYMLHPRDQETGISYRLIPMTRSIISEIADPGQARANARVIQEKLACPDGIRLMDRPALYQGGEVRFFQRAEMAANVGREISLQYVHAHIRYIEAMAKLGMAGEAWESLFRVIPAGIRDSVKNGALRQANTYFSSSEGAYRDRYEYQEQFDRLFDGSIGVKGGWRLYSSGPGICMANLIGNLCGIRLSPDGVELDPVLPEELDGLVIRMECFGEPKEFCCHGTGDARTAGRVCADGKEILTETRENRYREGGRWIETEAIRGKKRIDIWMEPAEGTGV